MNEQVKNQADDMPVDDWAAAFEALATEEPQDDKADELEAGEAPEGSGPDKPEEHEGEQPDFGEDPDGNGGLASEDDLVGAIAGGEEEPAPSITQAEIDEVINDSKERARNTAIREVAEYFIKEGVRNTNGKLGATIDDPDICKKDKDGVPMFFNPETGRPFTGDNPRRQAMEWVDDYNKELAAKFNQVCAQREAELIKEDEPRIQTLRFQPTYDRLDPIRQGMLDDIISDYEVKDADGDVIGYSCDLNRALDVVNRQISRIQGYAKNRPRPATGPAMDMKTSSGANTGMTERPKISSLEEAMEYEQNKMLEKMKNGRK